MKMSEPVSILSAFGLAAAAAYLFWFMPNYSPTTDWPKYALAWIVIGYLAVQLIALLQTVLEIRLSGILDSVLSIVPFVVGLVALLNAAQGHIELSAFQYQALYLLLATSLLDFLITMWIRFAVNRRTFGVAGFEHPQA